MCLRSTFYLFTCGDLRFRRYSHRTKELLERYELIPPAKIIEVDLRGALSLSSVRLASEVETAHTLSLYPADDGDFIKAVLTRLTGRSTFPNVILRGKSIGGSDDLAAMHEDGRLLSCWYLCTCTFGCTFYRFE